MVGRKSARLLQPEAMICMDSTALDHLVDVARSGNHAAFTAVMEAVVDDLRLFIAARCVSQELVDEVLQASLVACFQSLGTYHSEGTFVPWLKGVARNLLSKRLREQSRHRYLEGDELEAALHEQSLQRMSQENEENDAQQLSLVDCLRNLSPRARELLERHHVQGLELAVLARQFKQTTLAIASALKRIRRSLRECVEASAVS